MPTQRRSENCRRPEVQLHQRRPDPVPCRAVFAMLSRTRGLPASSNLNPLFNGSLPLEDTIFGIGVVGYGSRGMFARLGIYGIQTERLVFKFPISINTKTGEPTVPGNPRDRRSLAEAEFAMINWIQGGLFSQLAPGNYHMRVDRINAAGPPDLDEERDIESLCRNLPDRKALSMERRIDSALEHFDEHLERDCESPVGLKKPLGISQFPLITPDMVPTSLTPGPNQEGILDTVRISPETFSSFSSHRMTELLRNRPGDYREAKAAFIRSFSMVDSIIRNNQGSMLSAAVDRSIATTRQVAMKYLSGAGGADKVKPKVIEQLDSTLALLRTYAFERRGPVIEMFSRPQSGLNPTLESAVQSAFKIPAFVAVKSIPVQILGEYQSNGDFPHVLDYNLMEVAE